MLPMWMVSAAADIQRHVSLADCLLNETRCAILTLSRIPLRLLRFAIVR